MGAETKIAVLGGGCFWCTEAVFKSLAGVESVTPGYAGGSLESAKYELVSNGDTGHAEVIQIVYDPAVISFETLLTVFFASHDPSTINRQGNDVGSQYRSVIFYSDDEQKNAALAFIAELNASSPEGKPIVTEVAPLDMFYPAENYHQNYYANNPEQSYCQVVINPKLQKIQEKFAELLKDN